MALHLTKGQRLEILRYVADHCVDGVCPTSPRASPASTSDMRC
jgi:hypothetical protein